VPLRGAIQGVAYSPDGRVAISDNIKYSQSLAALFRGQLINLGLNSSDIIHCQPLYL